MAEAGRREEAGRPCRAAADRLRASTDARPHNLPAQTTALLGREREIDEVRQILSRTETRLVTLTGAGGSGKTRLSLQVAAELLDRFEDGVFLVELAPVRDPSVVPATVAQALGVRDIGNRPVLASLKDHLRRRSLLLVLDNFEQILPAAPVVAELLAECPGLTVLVTSREPLRLRGEHEYEVPPLALPGARPGATPEDLGRYAAVALFVERAAEIRADFALTAANAPAVAEICQRLDGLPLAIELAAARVRLLTPQAILSRLERRLPLLTGGSRDAPERQRTLRDAIAWSYDLLPPAEQALFRRLAIFVGGSTVEAAEAAATADVGDPRWSLAPEDVLGGIESLTSRSLLRRLPGPDGTDRIGMLETVREFGLERLEAAGELYALRRWHTGYFLALAERAVPLLRGAEQRAWLDRLDADHANLRAALVWSLDEDRESDAALRLSGALAWFWTSRCHFAEGRRWLARALAMPTRSPEARSRALYGAGWMAHIHHDAEAAREYLDPALALAQERNDRWAIAWTLHVQGRVAYFADDAERARELATQSLRVARELDDHWLVAWALHLLGLAAHLAADYPAARAYYEEALALRWPLGYQEGIGICFNLLSVAAYREGNSIAALGHIHAGMTTLGEVGVYWTMNNALAMMATLAVAFSKPRRGVRLAAATSAHGDAIDVRPIPIIQEVLVEALAAARCALGDADYAAAWAEGQALSLEEAVAEALALEEQPADVSPRAPGTDGPRQPVRRDPPTSARAQAAGSGRPAGLSPREVEVLRSIAAGSTSKEIAEKLRLSVRTVERHITHVYTKIGARGRADATAFALRHGIADEDGP